MNQTPNSLPRRRLMALALGFAGASFAAGVGPSAHADSLTYEEQMLLNRGEVVRRDIAFETEDGRYVGGVAYVLMRAPAKSIIEAVLDTKNYTRIFPLLATAKEIGKVADDRLITLEHYTRFANAFYTLRVRRESPHLVRFWMEPAYAHDLDDCWGYFRVQPISKTHTLVTYGAALNLGFGITRMLFESKIQGYAMEPPQKLKYFMEHPPPPER